MKLFSTSNEKLVFETYSYLTNCDEQRLHCKTSEFKNIFFVIKYTFSIKICVDDWIVNWGVAIFCYLIRRYCRGGDFGKGIKHPHSLGHLGGRCGVEIEIESKLFQQQKRQK